MTIGVRDAVTTGADAGDAADGAGDMAGTATVAEAASAKSFICCKTCSARALSRRLRSSETLSVAVCRDTTFLGFGRGWDCSLSGSSTGASGGVCAISNGAGNTNPSVAASASADPARRQAGNFGVKADGVLIAGHSERFG